MDTECLVVGASVVGGVTAREAAKKGVRTVLLADSHGIGKNGKCTCIVSASGLPKTGIKYGEAVLHEITGANIRHGSACMTVRKKETAAFVLDRFKLDAQSVGQAEDAGAEIKKGARFAGFKEGTATTAAGEIKTEILIGTDGIASSVARECSFPPLEKIAVAWEGEYANAKIGEPEMVDVFLDFPGLFGWAVPAGEKTVRVGLAGGTNENLQAHKQRLLQKGEIKKMLGGTEKVREFYHSIPLKCRSVTQKENVLLVGDAAGQAKATTGGGIVFGSLCALEAAGQAKAFLEGGGELAYERAWREKYGKTLARHTQIREALDGIPGILRSAGLSAAGLLGVGRLLEAKGDMDFITR